MTTTATTTATTNTGYSRFVMARSRGAVTGPLLMLLGAWGAIVPFVGHYFGYGFTPDNTWTWTAARGWFEVLPGAATFVGGALLTYSAHRASAMLGGWLAAAGGAWFVLGTVFMPLIWSPTYLGVATGGTTTMRVLDAVGMFYGLGALILLLAGIALGRTSVVGVRDVAAAEAAAAAAREREIDVRDREAYPVEPTATTATTPTTETTTTGRRPIL